MSADSYYVIGVAVAGLLAIANVWRGIVLARQGESQRARTNMLLGAVMLMFMVTLLITR